MRIKVSKPRGGRVDVRARRTRSWEKRQLPELNIPQDQLGAAVENLVTKMRDENRPGQQRT